ncbi:MAG: hypothetical protein EU521_00135 [Promethearchaeota archaeon]|nr:MAG: hypothetical protein EU521_00135 [Candidatus Lokiarchaeota archaeon]
MECYFCRNDIKGLAYNCPRCGMKFCSNHRLPENHNCSNELFHPKISLKYEDVLDFNPQNLSVADVYHLLTTKRINEDEATQILKCFIEKNDFETKINSINAFMILELKSPTAYSILEDCVVSGEKEEAREAAANVLKKIFPKISKNILKWYNSKKIKK